MGPGWDAVTNNMVVTDSNSLLYSRVFSNFAIITGNSTVIAISCGPSLGGAYSGGVHLPAGTLLIWPLSPLCGPSLMAITVLLLVSNYGKVTKTLVSQNAQVKYLENWLQCQNSHPQQTPQEHFQQDLSNRPCKQLVSILQTSCIRWLLIKLCLASWTTWMLMLMTSLVNMFHPTYYILLPIWDCGTTRPIATK
jgi:hypothetical protein